MLPLFTMKSFEFFAVFFSVPIHVKCFAERRITDTYRLFDVFIWRSVSMKKFQFHSFSTLFLEEFNVKENICLFDYLNDKDQGLSRAQKGDDGSEEFFFLLLIQVNYEREF